MAVVQVGLLVGSTAVVSAELLGAFGALNRWSVLPVWLALILGLGVRGYARRQTVRRDWRLGPLSWALLTALAVPLVLEFLVAIVAPPNNWDSQAYHLSKVEHWVAVGGVGVYPTASYRQIGLGPGAEYLLLHLRLLTGGDALYNLVQFTSLLLCLAAATRITAQLGGNRVAQLITGVLIASAPMVVLQATSTQNDLVVAAWVACLATLVLDGVTRRSGPKEIVFIGLATGMVAVTKTTGLLAAAPLLLAWGFAQLWLIRRDIARRQWRGVALTAAGSLAIVALAGVLAGPHAIRMKATFGSPLGPADLQVVQMQRHDPSAVLVNVLRIGQTAMDVPFAGARSWTIAAVSKVADGLGVDVNDPAITLAPPDFPMWAWEPDEDTASSPLAFGLALVAWLVATLRPRGLGRSPTVVRLYAGTVGVAFLAYAGTLRWQPWGNRLLLFVLVMAIPLAGLLLGSVPAGPRRWTRAAAAAAATMCVVCSLVVGVYTVVIGEPRPLAPPRSVLTTDKDETRFYRMPEALADYRWAVDEVAATGEKRIGLVSEEDAWEYPLWIFLPGREFVNLRSVVASVPPLPVDSVNVIVCLTKDASCLGLVPASWNMRRQGDVAVATR